MAKDPAFLFYSNDFLSGTYTMSNEQVGKYIRLLCLQHQKGFLSHSDMMAICGTHDEDIFSKFTKCENGYCNSRLKEEAEKRKAYSESRRNNKMKSKHMNNTCATHVQHMGNENENENEDENEVERYVLDLFHDSAMCEMWKTWIAYKHQQFKFRYKTTSSEITAIKNLHTLSNGKAHIAIDIINQSIGNGWKGFFAIKQSANQTRFESRVDYANRHDS